MIRSRIERQVFDIAGSGAGDENEVVQYLTSTPGATNTTKSQAELDAFASTFGLGRDIELNSNDFNTSVASSNSIVNSTTRSPGFGLGPRESEFSTLAPELELATGSAGDSSGNQVILIVGITCGVVGLLIGIIITVGVWLYLRKRSTGFVSRKRHGSTMERNPKEMTFEPLDLSLTLPSYERNHIVKHRQSVNSYISQEGSTKRHSAMGDLNLTHSASSYHGFDAPTPPLEPYPIESASYLSYDNGAELFDDTRPRVINQTSDSYLPPLQSYHHFNSQTYRVARSSINSSSISLENRKRASSTRDSFSSGHGTGTDSDTLSYDPRRHYINKYQDDIPSDLEYSFNDKAAHRRQNSHRGSRNNSKLGIVRESTLRRSKRSNTSSKVKQSRSTDDSSTCASSGSLSVRDWGESKQTECPDAVQPSSNVNNTNSVALDQVAKSSAIAPSDGDSEWEESDVSEYNHSTKAADKEEDVLSTYFDIHFPPTPLRSQSLTKQKCLPLNTVSSFETPDHQVKLVRNNSDVTIEL